ncbi:peptidase m48 ste24p [Planoprotostelium fungivorum]|uniref:Peptidase m48 ste24p n=1 Tax=Planoprotostelium fungivorum TaxID=1890364 RepID=A0A2P6N8E3_9EUKA|nr:peptidase m48 ste24p [Planoprotostelium fungivorum]
MSTTAAATAYSVVAGYFFYKGFPDVSISPTEHVEKQRADVFWERPYAREFTPATDLDPISTLYRFHEKETKAVRQVGEKLVSSSNVNSLQRLNWRWTVVDSSTAMAFLLPNGRAYFTTGFLSRLDNEHHLATVISHEMSHLYARHHAERTGFRPRMSALWDMMNSLPLSVALIPPFFMKSRMKPYSRVMEEEADQISLVFMQRAGYRVWNCSHDWSKLERQQQYGFRMEYLEKHPLYQDRLSKFDQSKFLQFSCPPSLFFGSLSDSRRKDAILTNQMKYPRCFILTVTHPGILTKVEESSQTFTLQSLHDQQHTPQHATYATG